RRRAEVTARSRSRARRAFAGGLAAFAVVACGSSSPSQNQLRSQATAICSRANRLIGRIATPPSEAGGEAFLRRGIGTLTPELQQLKQLKAPDDTADVWSTAVQSLSGELSALQSTVAKIDGGADPTTVYKSLQQTLAPL